MNLQYFGGRGSGGAEGSKNTNKTSASNAVEGIRTTDGKVISLEKLVTYSGRKLARLVNSKEARADLIKSMKNGDVFYTDYNATPQVAPRNQGAANGKIGGLHIERVENEYFIRESHWSEQEKSWVSTLSRTTSVKTAISAVEKGIGYGLEDRKADYTVNRYRPLFESMGPHAAANIEEARKLYKKL